MSCGTDLVSLCLYLCATKYVPEQAKKIDELADRELMR